MRLQLWSFAFQISSGTIPFQMKQRLMPLLRLHSLIYPASSEHLLVPLLHVLVSFQLPHRLINNGVHAVEPSTANSDTLATTPGDTLTATPSDTLATTPGEVVSIACEPSSNDDTSLLMSQGPHCSSKMPILSPILRRSVAQFHPSLCLTHYSLVLT